MRRSGWRGAPGVEGPHSGDPEHAEAGQLRHGLRLLHSRLALGIRLVLLFLLLLLLRRPLPARRAGAPIPRLRLLLIPSSAGVCALSSIHMYTRRTGGARPNTVPGRPPAAPAAAPLGGGAPKCQFHRRTASLPPTSARVQLLGGSCSSQARGTPMEAVKTCTRMPDTGQQTATVRRATR